MFQRYKHILTLTIAAPRWWSILHSRILRAKVQLNAVQETWTAIGHLKLPCRESLQLCQRDRRPILTNPSSPSVDLPPSEIPPILFVPLAVVELRALALWAGDGHGSEIDGGDVAVAVAVVVVVVGDGVAVVAAVIAAVVERYPRQDMMCILVGQVQSEGSQTEGLAPDSLYSHTI